MGVFIYICVVYTLGIQSINPYTAGGMYYTAVAHIYTYMYYAAIGIVEETQVALRCSVEAVDDMALRSLLRGIA